MCVANTARHLVAASPSATKKVAPILEKAGGKSFAYDASGKPTMDNTKALAAALDAYPTLLAGGQALSVALGDPNPLASKPPLEAARLPADMQKLKTEGWEKDEWRYTLANVAARAAKKDGISYDRNGGAAYTKAVESYMNQKAVQEAAYREAYGGSAQGAPKALAALFEGRTGATATPPSITNKAPDVSTANAAASGQSLTPGTPEFEAEKQRRLAAWKDKAAQQLRIESPQNNERK